MGPSLLLYALTLILSTTSLAPYTGSPHQSFYPATNSKNTSLPCIQTRRYWELENALGPDAPWSRATNKVTMAAEGGSCLGTELVLQPDNETTGLAPYTGSSHQIFYPATNSTNTSFPCIQTMKHEEVEYALGPDASWLSPANTQHVLQPDNETTGLAPYTGSSHQSFYPATNSTNTSFPCIQAMKHEEVENGLGPDAPWLSPANEVTAEGGSCLGTQLVLQPDNDTTSLAPYTGSSHLIRTKYRIRLPSTEEAKVEMVVKVIIQH